MNKIITLIFLLCIVNTHSSAKNKASFFKDKTKLKNPFSLRDPFKAPLSATSRKKKRRLSDEGIFTNVPTVENVPLEKIKITGVFLGENRRATALLDNKDTVILKEGMKLGVDQAELKAILPGGVVLVERIINVYGQEEYLETVLPIADEE